MQERVWQDSNFHWVPKSDVENVKNEYISLGNNQAFCNNTSKMILILVFEFNRISNSEEFAPYCMFLWSFQTFALSYYGMTALWQHNIFMIARFSVYYDIHDVQPPYQFVKFSLPVNKVGVWHIKCICRKQCHRHSSYVIYGKTYDIYGDLESTGNLISSIGQIASICKRIYF